MSDENKEENKEENKASGLTPEQTKQALFWFNEKFPKIGTCPECSSPETVLGPGIVSPPAFKAGGSFSFGGRVAPVLPLICTVCGSTRYFNAIVMGLLKSEEKGGGDGQ